MDLNALSHYPVVLEWAKKLGGQPRVVLFDIYVLGVLADQGVAQQDAMELANRAATEICEHVFEISGSIWATDWLERLREMGGRGIISWRKDRETGITTIRASDLDSAFMMRGLLAGQ